MPLFTNLGQRVSNLIRRPLSNICDIEAVEQCEKSVYPGNPLYLPTPETFLRWFTQKQHGDIILPSLEIEQQFAMAYFEKNAATGVEELVAAAIYLPLNPQGFAKLASGEYNEVDIDPVHDMFRLKRQRVVTQADGNGALVEELEGDSEVALHVYHITKFGNSFSGFWKRVLNDTQLLMQELRQVAGSPITVTSYSAYVATVEGMNLFGAKFNCMEREYRSCEHVLARKDPETGKLQRIVVETEDQQEIYSYFSREFEYLNRF